jgi:hypothetical protein
MGFLTSRAFPSVGFSLKLTPLGFPLSFLERENLTIHTFMNPRVLHSNRRSLFPEGTLARLVFGTGLPPLPF